MAKSKKSEVKISLNHTFATTVCNRQHNHHHQHENQPTPLVQVEALNASAKQVAFII